DTVQAARGPVCATAELAPGMQGSQDDLQSRLFWKPGVSIDRDAAAVVAHRNPITGRELDLDSRGMACDGLVHRVVEDFSGEVMQHAFVRAADIHAGPAANRLQAFKNLDILCGIAVRSPRDRRVEKVRHSANIMRDKVCAKQHSVLVSGRAYYMLDSLRGYRLQ